MVEKHDIVETKEGLRCAMEKSYMNHSKEISELCYFPNGYAMTEPGLESKTGAFKRAIRELMEQDKIEYTIPEKPNSRLQQYRLEKSK